MRLSSHSAISTRCRRGQKPTRLTLPRCYLPDLKTRILQETKRRLTDRYAYDSRVHRYRDLRTGRFVDWNRTVRPAMERALDTLALEIRQLGAQAGAGQIDDAAFVAAMKQKLKIAHLMSYALAKGGWAQMTSEDFGRVGRELRKQYDYLARFGQAIRQGKLSQGQAAYRAALYARAAYATYENTRRLEMQRVGFTEERRRRTAKESCPDCIEYARRGWQPIGTLPPIGQSRCIVNCRCYFEYRYRRG